MVDIEFIRKKHFVEGWSIRRISRQLQVARQTVRKALASADVPHYRRREARPQPVMGPFAEVVKTWLAADATAPRKQRHTARRIYDRLVTEYDFAGGESTVRRLVRELKQKTPEVFVPLQPGWGEMGQVDWGQATVILGGLPTVIHLFILRLRRSGVVFAWAFPTEKMEAFLEGHARAFSWLQGVPAQLVYDNLKTAVVRILAGPERQEHQHFSSLRAHYLFDSLFCNPASGNEKGSVENGVGYVRRNALVPMREFADWQALNSHLLRWCEKERERRSDAWVQERAALRPLPAHPFRPAITRFVPVNRLSLVHFDRNRYSVPSRCVGKTLRLDAYADRVEVWDGEKRVATHARYHGRGETVMVLEHYLPVLAQKPRATVHAAVVRELPPVYQAAREQLLRHPQGYRDFTRILLLHQEFAADQVAAALREALDRQVLGPDSVRQILLNRAASPQPPRTAVPPLLAQTRVAVADPSRYDLLLGRWGA